MHLQSSRPTITGSTTRRSPRYERKAVLRRPGSTDRVKSLNNRLGSDHGELNHLVRPGQAFKFRKTAHNTIREFEVMRMF
ncbi:DDE-type integrase/transposase/recombinase [Aureimonas sp. AU20]|uniref:DDE-type integrase/transposase/recombinase n=1 Tax=Aureimonas sp. AU20 TaxID=1349819 RepID=UPI0035B5BBA6